MARNNIKKPKIYIYVKKLNWCSLTGKGTLATSFNYLNIFFSASLGDGPLPAASCCNFPML